MTAKAKQGSQALAIGGKTARQARVQGIDQIWIINLDRRRDRLERFMQAHPEMLGRINRLPAYDGKTLELTPDIVRLFAPNNFDWHKPTIGCAMSHLALWQKLADDPDDHAAYLILEDDARLAPSWVASVERAFNSGHMPGDWQVAFLGGILPKYRGFFEQNVEPVNRSLARIQPDCRFGKNPAGYFHFCAYAYLLNKRGAKRLLELVTSGNGVWMQADFLACYTTPALKPPRPVYFFHPLLAHSFQDHVEGYSKPYNDEGHESDRIDSDIWKAEERFGAEEIGVILRPTDLLDIPAALNLPTAGQVPSGGPYKTIRWHDPAVPFTVRISLLHATRGRPEQASEARKLWLRKANKPERVEHIFALDHDDESSKSIKQFHHVVQTHDGYSVGAWNLAARHSTGDILVQMSDDWDPPVGWDDLIAGSLDISLERVLWVNEDYTRKDIMCMAILTRKYYQKHGLFDARFRNVYSDDDFTARAKQLSAITYARNIVFKHKHFTTGDSPLDATYSRCNDHKEYHRAKLLFDSIHNAAPLDGIDIDMKDNQICAESGRRLDATREQANQNPEQKVSHRAPTVPKAHHADWSGRFREVISDPLNILISKHPLAGMVSGNDVYLHTGLKVPLAGPLSYYSEFSQILALNRGIHEPLEEFVFQQVIPWLPQRPSMLELGAYWAHYSMWLLANRPEAKVCMVEPDQAGLKAGTHNFRTNGFEGEFINAFVQAGGFEVDGHLKTKGQRHLDILHADIQGYELQMLEGARNALGRKQIDYVFVSTHSQEIHEQVCHVLRSLGYRVEVEADFDLETTSMDGFVFATSPLIPPVFQSFKPLGRVAITKAKPDPVFEYLEKVRSCINPAVVPSNLFLTEVSGVIHVGANTGQERHIYGAYGLSVLWVEPIGEVFAALEANLQSVSGQIALNALVADVNGKEYDLHIANNGGASSSIFEMKQHKKIWPEVDYVSKVRCKSITLPTLLEKAGVNVGEYDALVLDTQGSELLVLKGASSLLQGFKFIKVEVPDFESYEGCCRDADVSAFMSQHNFEEIFRSRFAGQSGTGNYFDVVYKRRS